MSLDEQSSSTAIKKLEVFKILREDSFAELTAIRDSMLSISKSKFSLFKAKYQAAKDVLQHAKELKAQILQWNLEVDIKYRLDTTKTHVAFLQLFDVIEAKYTSIMDDREQHVAGISTNPSAAHTMHQGVKLPSIVIPTFENSLREFPKFEKLFSCVYGSNSTLSDSAKAYYLHSHLRGEALSLVSEFALDSQGYQDAWVALRDMYASERALASVHVTDILSFTPLKKATGEGLNNYLAVHNHHVKSLKNLSIPDLGDFLLQELSARNLDPLTRRLFEQSLQPGILPTHTTLMEFVNKQSRMYEILKSENAQEDKSIGNKSGEYYKKLNGHQQQSAWKPKSFQARLPAKSNVKSNLGQCLYCQAQGHKIYTCQAYQSATTAERCVWVRNHDLCPSCLGKGHTLQQCRSTHKCKTCGISDHHSSLHTETPVQGTSESVGMSANSAPPPRTMSVHQTPTSLTERTQVLLGTLVANVVDAGGFTRTIRAVLDTGSQKNLISLKAIKRLGINPKSDVQQTICGISDVETNSLGLVSINLLSRTEQPFSLKIEASVLPHITSELPSTQLPIHLINQFKQISLADPNFGKPAPIELLLNAEVFMKIVNTNISEPSCMSNLNTLSTKFGTVVMGNVKCLQEHDVCLLTTPQAPPLLRSLERFWELEEVPPSKLELTVEEQLVENQFIQSHSRAPDGRFIVKLPFKPDQPELGWNRRAAAASVYSLEKRLKRSPSQYEQYQAILKNYIAESHIIKSYVPSNYVIPHHCVTKKGSNKLRIVFNASSRSTTGVSMNDTLYIGPSLLRDLSHVLMGFRIYPIALSADISTMYTNVVIHPNDAEKLHMFCLNESNELIECAMARLPFGLSCSPFLAMRCLRQVALEELEENKISSNLKGNNHTPKACQTILNSFYVDDVLTGAFSVEDATNLRDDLVKLLAKGCFPLGKFNSNHPSLCSTGDSKNNEIIFSAENVKVLGLYWKTCQDVLSYKTSSFEGPMSKRNILSYCSQLYDPLGLVNPVTLSMKLFIQELWRNHISWDEILNLELTKKWTDITTHIPMLSKCKIARWIYNHNAQHTLAIFCDGSQLAYGTCAYLVSHDPVNGTITSNLIAAKSKVAPIKSKLTIPQVELSGMLLASKLWRWFKNGNFPLNIHSVHFFSDSQVSLSWLKIEPSKLKVFVSNRVKQVLELSFPHPWHYVATKDNPADLVSRGIMPEKLLNNTFWFNGPNFLTLSFPPGMNQDTLPECDLPDLHISRKTLVVTNDPPEFELFNKYSTLTKLLRVFAYIKRFCNNCLNVKNAKNGPLSVTELKTAMLQLSKLHQSNNFSKDMKNVRKTQNPSSDLLPLTPFLDDENILRVGGRLNQSNLEYNAKHPIILAKGSHFTSLVLKHYHANSGHSGPSLSLALTRQNYWPIAGRAAMRSIVKNCVICAKLNANRTNQPIMGDLPSYRTQPTMAFRGHVAFDAAGPFSVKLSQRQTRQSISAGKGYLLLWICLSTRAVHLEFMGSLSAESFLAAWDRMVSRRGIPSCCVSDQASNFKKGSRLIKEFSQFLEENKDTILSSLATRSIDWQFNVVYSPDKGGIWERQIGVAKRILKGMVQSQTLFFEEYATLFAKVEALMNSRPYFPLSSDATDPLAYLTPAHFLIQSNFSPLPEKNLPLDMPLHRRWDRVRALTQQFWKIWSREYLQSRIAREKWAKCSDNIEIGQMVLLTDIQTAPSSWPLGIVVNLIMGSQGASRVADVQTSSGIVRRSVNRLRLIPVVHKTS